MKKTLILSLLIFTMNSNATLVYNLNHCMHHDAVVGIVFSQSTNESVLGSMCFTKFSETTSAKNRERVKDHNINSPECWKGYKEDFIGNERPGGQ